ncbi:hypothetical protein [Sphingobacterium psychroaquaticum]|uniref:Uncharacterized protein n=1 Tax=Sphingobacterium psychroaquaticum TaxID=561061 RepID=A0A1X7KP55_9SPHI|nr:hypothetical protein [Sphingobacterium psychroaquaticum]QBQ40532.1 hypothetical protein E2P86_04945 [Sphingobacterium psychroaquaticum]SMG43281.1 hypothetical protein SAMN05660862_3075 [Sphingobacterium psychroaquaticum]
MSKTEKKQIKSSILMVVGMLCLLIGLNNVPNLLKYSALVLSLTSFLYLIFCFIKDAKDQITAVKGKISTK